MRAGYALDREKKIDDERRKITPHLVDELLAGNDHVVVGLPGSGKSTILKSIACHWHERQHGTVLYRSSRASKQFDEIGPVKQRVDSAEGHVLVVVEDATRDAANAVFELREEYEGDRSVSFLLDSRMTEWEDDDFAVTDARRGVSKAGVDLFTVPQFDPEEPREVERAVEHFERTTGVEIDRTPRQLYRDIETNLGAGEMYLLGYRLSSYALGTIDENDREWSGLRVDGVRPVYNDLVPEAGEDSLARKVGLLVSILTAAEIDVYREYLAALAETEAEYREVVRILGETRGRLHYGRSNWTYRTNHPLWAMLFLEEGLLRGDEHEERVVDDFEEAVNALFRFLEDPARREEVDSWTDSERSAFELAEGDARALAGRVTLAIFDVPTERPALASLFGTTERSEIEIPTICRPETEIGCVNRRGAMFLNRGSPESDVTGESGDEYADFNRTEAAQSDAVRSDLQRAEAEFELRKELIEFFPVLGIGAYLNLGIVAARRGNFEVAQQRFSEAKARFGEIGDTDGVAKCAANLGRIYLDRGDLDAAESHYEEARSRFEAIGSRFMVARTTDFLGEIAKQRDNHELACDRFETAIEVFLEVDAVRDLRPCIQSLAETHESLDDQRRVVESWERLIPVAERTGYDDLADQFRAALADLESSE